MNGNNVNTIPTPETAAKLDLALDALRAGQSFLILSHISPDGDALGSIPEKRPAAGGACPRHRRTAMVR